MIKWFGSKHFQQTNIKKHMLSAIKIKEKMESGRSLSITAPTNIEVIIIVKVMNIEINQTFTAILFRTVIPLDNCIARTKDTHKMMKQTYETNVKSALIRN